MSTAGSDVVRPTGVPIEKAAGFPSLVQQRHHQNGGVPAGYLTTGTAGQEEPKQALVPNGHGARPERIEEEPGGLELFDHAVVPSYPHHAGTFYQESGPFGNFIAVALSTLLTILLAWRVLFEDEQNSIKGAGGGVANGSAPDKSAANAEVRPRPNLRTDGGQQIGGASLKWAGANATSTHPSRICTTPAKSVATTTTSSSSENTTTKPGQLIDEVSTPPARLRPALPNGGGGATAHTTHSRSECKCNRRLGSLDGKSLLATSPSTISPTTTTSCNNFTGSTSANSSHNSPAAAMGTLSPDHHAALGCSDFVPLTSVGASGAGYESDVSTGTEEPEEDDERPLFLDTITEEDTDDLRSVGSSSDGFRSPLSHVSPGGAELTPGASGGSYQRASGSVSYRPLSIAVPNGHLGNGESSSSKDSSYSSASAMNGQIPSGSLSKHQSHEVHAPLVNGGGALVNGRGGGYVFSTSTSSSPTPTNSVVGGGGGSSSATTMGSAAHIIETLNGFNGAYAGAVQKKSPSEERFLKAYHNYVSTVSGFDGDLNGGGISSDIPSASATSSTTTLSDDGGCCVASALLKHREYQHEPNAFIAERRAADKLLDFSFLPANAGGDKFLSSSPSDFEDADTDYCTPTGSEILCPTTSADAAGIIYSCTSTAGTMDPAALQKSHQKFQNYSKIYSDAPGSDVADDCCLLVEEQTVSSNYETEPLPTAGEPSHIPRGAIADRYPDCQARAEITGHNANAHNARFNVPASQAAPDNRDNAHSSFHQNCSLAHQLSADNCDNDINSACNSASTYTSSSTLEANSLASPPANMSSAHMNTVHTLHHQDPSEGIMTLEDATTRALRPSYAPGYLLDKASGVPRFHHDWITHRPSQSHISPGCHLPAGFTSSNSSSANNNTNFPAHKTFQPSSSSGVSTGPIVTPPYTAYQNHLSNAPSAVSDYSGHAPAPDETTPDPSRGNSQVVKSRSTSRSPGPRPPLHPPNSATSPANYQHHNCAAANYSPHTYGPLTSHSQVDSNNTGEKLIKDMSNFSQHTPGDGYYREFDLDPQTQSINSASAGTRNDHYSYRSPGVTFSENNNSYQQNNNQQGILMGRSYKTEGEMDSNFKTGQPPQLHNNSSSAAGIRQKRGVEFSTTSYPSDGLKSPHAHSYSYDYKVDDKTLSSVGGGRNLNSSQNSSTHISSVPVAQNLRHIDVTASTAFPTHDCHYSTDTDKYGRKVRQPNSNFGNYNSGSNLKDTGSNSFESRPPVSGGGGNNNIFGSGNNYQLPKVIPSVQYKPPGVSIKHQFNHLSSPNSNSASTPSDGWTANHHSPASPSAPTSTYPDRSNFTNADTLPIRDHKASSTSASESHQPSHKNVNPDPGSYTGYQPNSHTRSPATDHPENMSSNRGGGPYISRATERYEHYERSVEVLQGGGRSYGHDTRTPENGAPRGVGLGGGDTRGETRRTTNDVRIYTKDYGPIMDVRTKPIIPRGKIPWATASVFPASQPNDYREIMPSKPESHWTPSRPTTFSSSGQDLSSPSRVKVTSFESGKVTPIDPPSDWTQVDVERSVVKPTKLLGDQYCSSDVLAKLIQPYASDYDLATGETDKKPSSKIDEPSLPYTNKAASERQNRSRPESRNSGTGPESTHGGATTPGGNNGNRSFSAPRWERTGSWHHSPSKATSASTNHAEKGSTPSKGGLAGTDRSKSKESLPEEKKSVETLFPVTPPGSTGKPTRTEPKTYATEKGEPPKRPVPLNERNLEWWTSLPQNRPDSSSNLMRWRHSINLSDEEKEEENKKRSKSAGATPTKVHTMTRRDAPALPLRSEMDAEFQNFKRSMPKMSELLDDFKPPPQKPPPPPPLDDSLTPFRRSVSNQPTDQDRSLEVRESQRNRYKAKIDKAKRNFIEGDKKASVGDLSKPREEFETKHSLNLDRFMRRPEAPRGPLLNKFNDPIFKSNVDIRYREVKPNYKTPEPLWDDEYRKLVAKAERVWQEYRKKSNPDLYRNNKAHSMGYLETDLDSGRRGADSSSRTTHETNLDDLHKSGGYIASQEQQRGRARTKSGADNYAAAAAIESSHSRAKSMDYLVDSRDKVEPPENELQKTVARILGKPPAGHTPSEHELRFKKSLEKLHLPGWYIESEYVGKPADGGHQMDRGGRERRTMPPSISSRATTPGYGYADRHDVSGSTAVGDFSYGANTSFNSRPSSTLPTPPATGGGGGPIQAPYRAPKDDNIPSHDTRYSKPWSYIDDSKTPKGTQGAAATTAPVGSASRPSPSSVAHVSSLGPTPYSREYRPLPNARDLPVQPPTVVHTQRHVDPETQLYRQPQRPTNTGDPQDRSKSQGSTQDIFNRYKDEINEMWHSRKSLRQSQSSLHELAGAGGPGSRAEPGSGPRQSSVPVATVKPRPQGYGVSPTPSSSTFGVKDPSPRSSSSAQKPNYQNGIPQSQQLERPTELDLPPAYPAPPPPVGQPRPPRSQGGQAPPQEEFSDALHTSTPVSSGQLPRKQYPERETVRPSPGAPSPSSAYRTPDRHDRSPGRGGDAYRSGGMDRSPSRPTGHPPPPPTSTEQPGQQRYDRSAAPSSVPRPYAAASKSYNGYTVAPVPDGLNQPRSRASKIVEVADLGAGPADSSSGEPSRPVASHVTLEEVLDSLLGLPARGTGRVPFTPSPGPLPTSAGENPPALPPSGQPIFTANHDAMLLAASHPHKAQEILKHEKLFVRCQYCGSVSPLQQAWSSYVTCRYCYTYYCGRDCRRADWNNHADGCSFSRVSTLCKEVIMKVRMDKEAQYRMSKVARAGYSDRGRGSVNFRFRHAHYASLYLDQGFAALERLQPQCLFYYTVQDLSCDNKDKQLIASCRRYKPSEKFVLSVSIIADCDVVPETPVGMRRSVTDDNVRRQTGQASGDPGAFQNRAQSLPPKSVKSRTAASRHQPYPPQQQGSNHQLHSIGPESVGDAKVMLKSILRSMENIAPGPVDLDQRPVSRNGTAGGAYTPTSITSLSTNPDFRRMEPARHSVSAGMSHHHHQQQPRGYQDQQYSSRSGPQPQRHQNQQWGGTAPPPPHRMMSYQAQRPQQPQHQNFDQFSLHSQKSGGGRASRQGGAESFV